MLKGNTQRKERAMGQYFINHDKQEMTCYLKTKDKLIALFQKTEKHDRFNL